ncbi:MAG: hypothetical protein H6833_10525 [Planctomycetes bacterium]|nr:hypothetical protein [Planctomycetota bacterium]
MIVSTQRAIALFALPFLGLAAFLGRADGDAQDSPSRSTREATQDEEGTAPSCTICHPGEHASLARSVHALFLDPARGEGYGKEASCLLCHTNGLAHQKAPQSQDAADEPGSGRAACIRCHTRLDPAHGSPLAASHPSRELARQATEQLQRIANAKKSGLPAPELKERVLPSLEAEAEGGIDLSGFARFGWRFVSVAGNERLFDHDFQLDSGARLDAIELRAERGDRELLGIEGGGLEDRSSWVRARSNPFDDFEARGGTRRTRWLYDAEGDWAALSSKRDQSDALVGYDIGTTRLELGWDRIDLDERTLASSIGNPDSSPLVPATGIPIDRRFVSDRFALSSESRLGDDDSMSLAFEVAWETTRQRDELRYARPSPDAPSFTEREDSQSRASRRGLDGSVRFAAGDDGAREIRAVLFGLDHDVRVVEVGTLEAFDTSAFRRDTLGTGTGSQRYLSAEFDWAEPIWTDGRLLVELGVRDLRDHLRLDLYETTIRTATSLTDLTIQNTLVRSTDHEARVGIEQRLFDQALELGIGYRYLEQHLLLPDLAALDNDYRAGTIRTHGPDATADWRPTDRWRVRADFRLQGTDDTLPTETQPEVGHFAKLRVRRKLGDENSDGHVEAWAKWRRGENDIASTEIDTQQYGIGTGMSPFAGTRLTGRLGFTRTRSRTLTNFYLAPSITPVPRFIRYRGDAFLGDILFDWDLTEDLRSTSAISMTDTDGSLDSSFWQLREELRYRLDGRATLGLRASYFDYDGDTTANRHEGYDAMVVFVYAELRL